MSSSNTREPWGLGRYILQFRAPIGLVLIAITLFMGYWAAKVQIATSFENFFPSGHQNTLLNQEFEGRYGGAQTLYLMLRVKHGDIYNFKTLAKIQDITFDFDTLPGVNHSEIFSLASYRVVFSRAVPGALLSTNYMYPKVPSTQAGIDELRHNVMVHHEPVQGLLTYDDKGALITASFNWYHVDYKALFDAVQTIIQRYQDDNTEIYVAGEPVISGWGYHYLRTSRSSS